MVSAILKVFADEGKDPVSAAHGETGRIAVLCNEQARFTIAVELIRVVHVVFLDKILKPKEAVIRILKDRGGICGAGVHHHCELAGPNLRTTWIEQLG